jgi:hypothetical protein
VKVKLFLYLIKYYAVKAYGGVDVYIHDFLTLALILVQWSALCSGRFTLEERAFGTNWEVG